jgi:hypothetical protein
MKSKWWKPLGIIGGGLLFGGLVIFQLSNESTGEIIGGCVVGVGVITAVVYFMMKQNSDEAL